MFKRNKKNLGEFRNKHPFKKRKEEADRILTKYPDRIPIIVENAPNSNLPPLDKKKYLVPKDLTMGQFVYTLRRRIKLGQHEAIFIFVNNSLPPVSSMISQIYKEHKDADGFLYGQISSEGVFG